MTIRVCVWDKPRPENPKTAPGNPVSIFLMSTPVDAASGSSPEAHTQQLTASSTSVARTFDGHVGYIIAQILLLDVEVDFGDIVLVLTHTAVLSGRRVQQHCV